MKQWCFELAKEIALDSTMQKRIGAVLEKGGKIINTGFNKAKYHTLARRHDSRTIHAEISAILGIPKDKMKGADIYTYRAWRNGKMASSLPCDPCQRVLSMAGVHRIFYTNWNTYEVVKL